MSSRRAARLLFTLAFVLSISACRSSGQSPPSPQQPPVPAPSVQTPPVAQSSALADDLPPLPVTPFPAARPMEIVRAVFVFAARHPEVLSHVPCFCGCETRGHRNNDDCFVASRDAAGRTTEWEPHGVG